ncbi:YggS family pyridoxal phosphate-dependent enzyme [Sanguibacter gelidistatuariae]|nr:YggS family pyridoxal phosphate-dependent enzyme [Sanguibacter gelidistatuariae]
MPATVAHALARVQERIDDTCHAVGRDRATVRLLLATKTRSADVVREALRSAPAGALLIGENRVQELVEKAPALADLQVTAHLIGPLQSNKINHALRALALHGHACVETIDSLELAAKLSARVGAGSPLVPLDVMIQVNVSGEESKAGVAPDRAVDLAHEVADLPGLALQGFMTIASPTLDERVARAEFELLRSVRDRVTGSGAAATALAQELSMGMSRDLEWAVAEGATIVRVGSAVFGARPS